jgi:Domain of Unknown Function (DUF1080)/Peptidase of plants and bacteria
MNAHSFTSHRYLTFAAVALLVSVAVASAEVKITAGHDAEGQPGFRLKDVPPPAKNDAASAAKFSLLDGEADGNGGGLEILHDGRVPVEADEPARNFFLNAGTGGGRILVDLNRVAEVIQVNTYSWHPSTRGPQVYKLYASDGTVDGFKARPAKSDDLEKSGWKLVAQVDTKSKGGGQHGVSIAESGGLLGKYRHLLFDISATETDDAFGNTFYSEIDVVEQNAPAEAAVAAVAEPFRLKSTDGYCDITIDTSGAPELKEWAETKLAPVLAAWFPKIVAMLPSEGYSAPKQFSVDIRPRNGVAAAGGTRITANSDWLKRELNREAIGALVHEVVHVVQQYGGARRNNPDAKRAPGWLVEGIPDYIRWFLYEPQSHGADLIWLQGRRNQTLSYDGMYRITANFLDYVVANHDQDKTLITKLNAACRQGKYTDDLWKEIIGKPLAELNDEWKSAVQKKLAAKAESRINTLTDEEKAAGWKLLFNGTDLAGWHNFKREGVRPGWQVKDGALVCADPHDAGDIVTTEKFGAFELELDYNISEGGNSGIIFHVTDEGGAVWATGPEFQLEDNAAAKDPQRCGWLYALYQPADDPKTGKPLDATKPAGEWNHIRLVISPEKCEHLINGVKYFEYVMGSEDFKARVAKSKFGKMPLFAKSGSGYLALQGDHGQVSFRNIKVRPLKAP